MLGTAETGTWNTFAAAARRPTKAKRTPTQRRSTEAYHRRTENAMHQIWRATENVGIWGSDQTIVCAPRRVSNSNQQRRVTAMAGHFLLSRIRNMRFSAAITRQQHVRTNELIACYFSEAHEGIFWYCLRRSLSLSFAAFMTYCAIFLRNEWHKTQIISTGPIRSMCTLKIVLTPQFTWWMYGKPSRKLQWIQSMIKACATNRWCCNSFLSVSFSFLVGQGVLTFHVVTKSTDAEKRFLAKDRTRLNITSF